MWFRNKMKRNFQLDKFKASFKVLIYYQMRLHKHVKSEFNFRGLLTVSVSFSFNYFSH